MSNSAEKIPSARLLSLPLPEFVEQAYLAILGRAADSPHRENYLHALRLGVLGRGELLELLSLSPEGRSRGATVAALPWRLRWPHLLRRLPLLGGLCRRARLLRHLPELLQELLDRQAAAETAAAAARARAEEQSRLAAAREERAEEQYRLAAVREERAEERARRVEEQYRLAAAREERVEAQFRLAAEANDLAGQRLAALEAGVDAIRLETRRAVAEYRRYLLELAGPSSLPAPSPPPATAGGFAASLYASFEDEFRGTPEEVRRGLAVYLPWLRGALARQPALPVLDLGCGRGEWLELLALERIPAQGVDRNPVVVASLAAQGFAVTQADLFAFLATLPPGGVAAVTAFHVVEHLAPEQWLALLDEMRRVLAPGGIAILETPNPRNILVGAGDFYRDPTHLRPLFPDTLQFFGRVRGFANSTAYFFAEERAALIPMQEYPFAALDDYLRVSRDYAWIGGKES